MIVVMAHGYARRAGQPEPDLAGRPLGHRGAEGVQEMTAAFEDDVTQALIPYVDSTFRPWPIASTGPWPVSRWGGCRRSR